MARTLRPRHPGEARELRDEQLPLVTKGGRSLDATDLERIADEFEAGFDLSTWERRPRPVGRPRLEPQATEDSPRIAVRVPASLRTRVQRRATQEGRSVSEVVRGLLEEYARPRR
jgi:hypothetical protein